MDIPDSEVSVLLGPYDKTAFPLRERSKKKEGEIRGRGKELRWVHGADSNRAQKWSTHC